MTKQKHKITKEKLIEIENLHKDGISLRKISKEMGVNYSTIGYHLNKSKYYQTHKRYWKKKTLEQRQKIYKKRLPYLKEYQKKRYKDDEEFRNRRKEISKRYYQKTHSKPVEDNVRRLKWR